MKLNLSGSIYDANNTKIGEYGYSFISCRYSFVVNKAIHHFFKEDELIEYLTKNNYHI
jgi:hypothetical protein